MVKAKKFVRIKRTHILTSMNLTWQTKTNNFDRFKIFKSLQYIIIKIIVYDLCLFL